MAKKSKNMILIVTLLLFMLLIVPWGNIYESLFRTARSEEDIIKMAKKEFTAFEDKEVFVAGEVSFPYPDEDSVVYWVTDGSEAKAMFFTKNDKGEAVFHMRRPVIDHSGGYLLGEETVTSFCITEERIKAIEIDGEVISVDKYPFVYTRTGGCGEYNYLDINGNVW